MNKNNVTHVLPKGAKIKINEKGREAQVIAPPGRLWKLTKQSKLYYCCPASHLADLYGDMYSDVCKGLTQRGNNKAA